MTSPNETKPAVAPSGLNEGLEALECPFCGKRVDFDDADVLYPSGMGWKFDKELQMRTYHQFCEVPKNQWCWEIHCPIQSGGCGAEMHGDTKEETLKKWNRRISNANADAIRARNAKQTGS
ncbi:MAG TPA: hypothetical protein VIY48_16920 [Candidatus Paceibacterota bacterium]